MYEPPHHKNKSGLATGSWHKWDVTMKKCGKTLEADDVIPEYVLKPSQNAFTILDNSRISFLIV